jgi:hypothetical protein
MAEYQMRYALLRKGFPEVGEELKASLSKTAPAEIEYIVIVSDIEKVSCKVHQDKTNAGRTCTWLCCCIMASRRVNRKEWADSIRWCSTELEHLTWTKISGGVRCWDWFIYDRDDVNDPKSTVGVLAMWGTHSYFDARGYGPLGSSTVRLNCHLGQPNTATSCKWQQRLSMLQQACRKSGHAT